MLQLERPGQDNKDSLKDAGSKPCVFSVLLIKFTEPGTDRVDRLTHVAWVGRAPACPECVGKP